LHFWILELLVFGIGVIALLSVKITKAPAPNPKFGN
jgi:hypothetical protein